MSDNLPTPPPSGEPGEGPESSGAGVGDGATEAATLDPGPGGDAGPDEHIEDPASAIRASESQEGIEDPLDPLTVLSVERDEYLDTLRRVQADFENYKKRVVRQQSEQLDRAAEALVNKLIPALDTLELAVSHHEPGSEVGQVLGQVSSALYEVLSKEGLEKVDPVDQEFDPNEAEAVMYEPADEGQTGHLVIEVLRPGYRWRGRVLRPAMVKVKG